MDRYSTNHGKTQFERLNTKEFIPMFKGRPTRKNIISKDDQLNLKIALETAKNFEEFFKVV